MSTGAWGLTWRRVSALGDSPALLGGDCLASERVLAAAPFASDVAVIGVGVCWGGRAVCCTGTDWPLATSSCTAPGGEWEEGNSRTQETQGVWVRVKQALVSIPHDGQWSLFVHTTVLTTHRQQTHMLQDIRITSNTWGGEGLATID